jgi:hypothetical protein
MNPNFIHPNDSIENVLQNFSNRIPLLSSLPYAEKSAPRFGALRAVQPSIRSNLLLYEVINRPTPFDLSDI